MILTIYGPFDGTTWESWCQLVFKKVYRDEGYTHIPTSPGDFGLEGFTLDTGKGFQCYCPDNQHDSATLYDHQRDKINEDLKKLKLYEKELAAIFGSTKLRDWIFVTPVCQKNALVAYVRKKELEVRGWGLSIIDPKFRILIHDAGFYDAEINAIRVAAGETLVFDDQPPVVPPLSEPQEVYQANIARKSLARVSAPLAIEQRTHIARRLQQVTEREFLASEPYLKNIADRAPTLYFKLARIIAEVELQLEERSILWSGSPEELTEWVKSALIEMISTSLGKELSQVDVSKIARHVLARWLAVCSLDYE